MKNDEKIFLFAISFGITAIIVYLSYAGCFKSTGPQMSSIDTLFVSTTGSKLVRIPLLWQVGSKNKSQAPDGGRAELQLMHIVSEEGSFTPSFSLGRKFIKVEHVTRVNKFRYMKFAVDPPDFPRSIDKETFFKFKTGGHEWLNATEELAMKTRGVVEVIYNGTYLDQRCFYDNDYTPMHVKTANSSRHYHKLCPVLPTDGWSFQHFFDRGLTKIIQARDFLLDPEMKVLLMTPRASDRNVILGFLDKVGINRSQIVWQSGSQYTADYLLATCISPHKHPALWRTIRGLLGVPDKLPVPLKEGYIVQLTRAGNHNGGRHIINKEEVTKFLVDRYGKKRVVVFKGGYSLDDAIKIFSKASLILGIHGGAFYNHNFASRDATVLEFMPVTNTGYPKNLPQNMIFWIMSRMIGQGYWRMYYNATSKELDIRIDLKVLGDILTQIEKSRGIR